MERTRSAFVFCLMLASLASAQDKSAAKKDEKAPPPIDPAVAANAAQLKSMVKARAMDQDFLALNLVTALSTGFADKNPKDQKTALAALGDVFKLGPVRPADKCELYRVTADALGNCGKDAAAVLRKTFDQERINGRDYTSLRAQIIVAIGKTKDDDQPDWLLEQAMRSPDDEVAAAAGEALGNYDQMPLPKLREVCKRLIGRYGELDMKSKQPVSTDPQAPIDFGPQNAAKTLQWIAGKWNATLQKLTGEKHESAPDWQRWLNKNKDWERKKR
jgi:hypothetical protein